MSLKLRLEDTTRRVPLSYCEAATGVVTVASLKHTAAQLFASQLRGDAPIQLVARDGTELIEGDVQLHDVLASSSTACLQVQLVASESHTCAPSPLLAKSDGLLRLAPTPFKIACASIRSVRGQTQANIASHITFAERAAKQGAQLVCFPEGSIHSLWCTFDVEATTTELAANSEPIPGPTTQLLQSHCKRLGIAMAVGMNHLGMARMPNGKALNAYVIIDGSGVVHVQVRSGRRVN